MQVKSRIKCPDLGLTLASNALREALQQQKPVLPITLEELQGLCARERRPRILAGYLRW
ncbi:transposase [Centipeda periodontii DSM 2778]|uniref:Transposase n=1 Tax=Centipeda periodontii DSM 2778 TaxID=888060 RepID=F5RNP1_9FIRM|nr:transposase [Centipeda periodontii DSM 2778]